MKKLDHEISLSSAPWMSVLSRSDAGGDYAETGKQAKYNGPNKPYQHWLVRQKRHHGTGQKVKRPDCNLNRLNHAQPDFFRSHVMA